MWQAIAEFLRAFNFWSKRVTEHKDDPRTKLKKWNKQVDREILTRDEDSANDRIDDALNELRLRDASKGNTSRSEDKVNNTRGG